MGARTVYAVLEETARSCSNAPALHQPTGKGAYRTYTWTEYQRAAEEIACGLRRIGIQKGDTVALHSETRAEFYLADLGVLANGSISAALYTSYPAADQAGNLRASQAKAIFAEDPKTMQTLLTAGSASLAYLQWILLTGEAEGALTLEQLRVMGRQALEEDPQAFERIRAEVDTEDPAVLYLTSGATGEPKMGLVTHAALVANIDMGPQVLQLSPGDCTIAFLPSAHIAQRVVIELLPIRTGVAVWFSESLSKLPHEMKAVRPTFLLAPPRVWERVFASITAEVKKRGALFRRCSTALSDWVPKSHVSAKRAIPFRRSCWRFRRSPTAWYFPKFASGSEAAFVLPLRALRLWAKNWRGSTPRSECRSSKATDSRKAAWFV